MSTTRRLLGLTVLGVALGAPAFAQDKPPLFPAVDATATYRLIGPMAQQGMPPLVFSFQASTRLMRSEMPGMGYVVADIAAGRAFLVMDAMRTIMDVPPGQMAPPIGYSPTATFRREGTSRVAGQPCDLWFVQDGPNHGQSCITKDGLVLRVEGVHGGQAGGMEATEVTYARQDPARFQRPQGYQTMQGMPGTRPPGR